MNLETTTAHLIARSIRQRLASGVRFGLIAKGLPTFDPHVLCQSLQPASTDLCLALIGFDGDVIGIPSHVATNVEMAVAWRNTRDILVPLVVILNPLVHKEKIHSLEVLEPFTDQDLRVTICSIAESEAKGDGLRSMLWHELQLRRANRFLSLTARQVCEIYHNMQDHDVLSSLPYIGLLPDPALPGFVSASEVFSGRLRENKKQVEWLLSLGSRDHRTLARALSTSEGTQHRQTFQRIKRYVQDPTKENLSQLTLADVIGIRESKKATIQSADDGVELRQPSKRKVRSADLHLVEQLLSIDNSESESSEIHENIEHQAERIAEMFLEDLTDDYEIDSVQDESTGSTIRESLDSSEQYEVLIDPRSREEVASIRRPTNRDELHPLDEYMGVWVHPNVWGGHIHVQELPNHVLSVVDLLSGVVPLPFVAFRPIENQSKGSLVHIFAELEERIADSEEKRNLAELLRSLGKYRGELCRYRKLFLYFPNWANQVPQLHSIIEKYLTTYSELAARLQRVYRQVQDVYPDTVERAAAGFLALDAVIIDLPDREGSQAEAVVLTTLHPLHLWKWLQLAKLLQENQDILTEKEIEKATLAAQNMPTLLNTFSLHPQMFQPTRYPSELRLVLAGEIRHPTSISTVGIPFYESVARQSSTSDGMKEFVSAIRRFIVLYPPAYFGLTLVLVNPPQLSPILKELVHLYQDEVLIGARVYVYRIDERSASSNEWQYQDQEALELFREKPNWMLSVSLSCDSIEDIQQDLANRQIAPHIVLLCDPSEAIAQSAFRTIQEEATPFGVPVQLNYDRISDTVKLIPTPSGSIFDAYTGVRNALSGELQRSVIGLGNRSRIRLEHLRKFLDYDKGANWLAIADWPQGTLELPSDLGKRLAWRRAGARTVAIHTSNQDWQKHWQRQVKQKLLDLGLPETTDVGNILDGLQELFPILPQGLISLIKESRTDNFADAFDTAALERLLSVLIVLRWYREKRPGSVIIPIRFGSEDTSFADWYGAGQSANDADYLALWLDEEFLRADVMTVHAIKGTFDEVPPLSNASVSFEPLARFARTLDTLFGDSPRPRVLAPLRRALLRERLTAAVFSASASVHGSTLAQTRESKVEWAKAINELFSSTYTPQISLLDLRVALKELRRPIDVQRYRDDLDEFARIIVKLPATSLQPEMVKAEPGGVDQPYETPPLRRTSEESNEQNQESPSPSRELQTVTREQTLEQAERLRQVLIAYGIAIAGIDVDKSQVGPRFIRYWVKLQPPAGRLSDVQRYAEDIARELGSKTVPLIDNIPGERYIGIDLAREDPTSIPLLPALTGLPLEQSHKLLIAAGQSPAGDEIQLDLVQLPHMLVAGQTGSGKTMFLSSIIASLIWRHSAHHLRLLLVDPKQTDFGVFNKLPHLYEGSVFYEPEDAIQALRSLLTYEKSRRTEILREARCPNILEFNRRQPTQALPAIVVVIDEFADLILSLEKKERVTFERQVNRLAATGRAVGIHLVIATQRPTTDVITGTIKANIPARVSFRLPSQIDSRTILDRPGAENLLGAGDMLVSVNNDVQRIQGYFTAHDELNAIINDLEDSR